MRAVAAEEFFSTGKIHRKIKVVIVSKGFKSRVESKLGYINRSMFITILGILLCFLAIIVFGFKLMVLYGEAKDPQGGGGAPTLDGVIFPPIFFAFGLGAIGRRYPDYLLPTWGYVCIWLVGTVLIYLLHELIYRVIHSRARRRQDK